MAQSNDPRASAHIQTQDEPFRVGVNVKASRAVPAAKLIETLANGMEADRQRQVYNRAQSLKHVIDFLVDETARGL